MTRPLMFRCLLVVGLSAGAAAACGSTPVSSANTTVDGSVNTTTSLVIESSTSTARSQDAISVAVYWTRPYGLERPIDVPGYADDPSGPFPFVLFGSATNAGPSPIVKPQVNATWSVDGEVVHNQVATVVDPEGGALTEIAPGASADLVVVVDDEAVANRLTDVVPTFEVYDG